MPMHGKKRHPSRAYLLRCWREGESDQEPVWRFSVEEVLRERRQKGFNSLGALVAFLKAELGGANEDSTDHNIPQNLGG
jgi:hypothetical protein